MALGELGERETPLQVVLFGRSTESSFRSWWQDKKLGIFFMELISSAVFHFKALTKSGLDVNVS